MRLKSARFKNLIGISRASGLSEIYIDFTKAKHKITLIIGKNGSGKSTIMDSLHPLPDSASIYIKGVEGEKEIEYIDDDTLYRIRIVYPVNLSGERLQTKAFITKISNGDEIELNPNGNIRSYKSELFNRFNLDPNYVALTQLSSEDKGIGEKTPSERKKFVSNILDSVEVYNNIYKALNKRSSIFRSMINSIVAKIDSIGDAEQLNSTLISLENRLTRLNNEKNNLLKSLSDNEAIIKITDPDGSIQLLYNNLHSQLKEINSEIDINNIFLSKYEDYSPLEESLKLLKDTKDTILKVDNLIQSKKEYVQTLLISREEESKAIQLKTQRLNSLTSEFNYNELQNTVTILKNNIDTYVAVFKEIGIENFNITKDEYVTGLNTLKDLKLMVDSMRAQADLEVISKAIEYRKFSYNILDTVEKNNNIIDTLTKENENCIASINYNEGLIKTLDILKDRPLKCKIDECAFIKDALTAKSMRPEDELHRLTVQVDNNNDKILALRKDVEYDMDIYKMLQNINIIIRSIVNNSSILTKLPNGHIFGNLDTFLDKLSNGSTFNEINDIYKYIDRANLFEKYKNDIEVLTKMEAELKIYDSKNEMIEEISNEIEELTNKLSNVVDKIESSNDIIREKSIELEKLHSLYNILENVVSKQELNSKLNKSKNEIISKINTVTNNMTSIENAINNINNINSNLNNISKEIDPIANDRDKIKYSLTKLEEYNAELSEYKQKFDYIETVKKYSSPTKAGIQTLFMKMYMGKTLTLSNQLLSLLFDGKLELKPYIINEDEFRIPCKSSSSSILNDDISSCSSGERSIISMIISFALLQQSSTKYNILKLDELDGALDESNRSQFLTVLNILIEMLDVENCLMVSHSSEIELSNVDVIWLTPTSTEVPNGNIIFHY